MGCCGQSRKNFKKNVDKKKSLLDKDKVKERIIKEPIPYENIDDKYLTNLQRKVKERHISISEENRKKLKIIENEQKQKEL